MAAAHDIVAIRSTREILLIGPRLSLHAVPKRELLGEGEVRLRLREAISDPGDPAQLRLALARWGLDTQRTTRTRDLRLCDWIASLVGTGRLRAVIAPDTDTHLAALPKTHVPRAPVAAALNVAREARSANAGRITAEKSAVFAVARAAATPTPMPASMPGAAAPRMPLNVAQLDLEERLMIVLARTVESDRLTDAAKAELQALIAPETIAITVGVLALWAGSHLTPFGYVADAILLGVGVFFAGRAVLEGGKKLAQFLGLTLSAKTEADLDLAADMLAAAIALLSVKLFAKLLSRGASGLNGAGKPKREKAPKPVDDEQIQILPKGKMNTDLDEAPPQAKPKPKPKPANERLNELKTQGHGPQRHEGDVTEQQLKDRAQKKLDPETGSRADNYNKNADGSPKNHKCGDHATKVNSPEAYTKAEDHMRASDEFKKAAAANDDVIKVEKPLEEIYGAKYKDHVNGQSRTTPWPDQTTPTQKTDFSDGSMKSIYQRNDQGGYDLTTMYPEPK